MMNARKDGRADSEVEEVLAKLAPDDRAVLQGALDRAEKTESELRFLADHD